ncbi:hypothetical protein GOBAR_AA39769 [Gossypium barbadense]|uniref:Uncharacterized protein n=1 Tax=Gossypium barbadense TaxID=3634 RepID=A0A2P5VQ62_GOSBA|nr:hypothetical protein GOBAR_AA39769 [Gossypium barbadense]
MATEESPQVTRRATRSYSASNTAIESTNLPESYKPTINDLGFRQQPLRLEDLLSSFPGRRSQILELLRLLGPLNSPMFPILVYGGPSTGKTSVTLQVFRHLNRPFIYSSCITCYSPRILFESILNQLLFHRKDSGHSYSSVKRCERPSDFVNYLREALENVLTNLKGNSGKVSSKMSGRPDGTMVYLVFDNLEKRNTKNLINIFSILKASEKSMDQKEMAEQELLMKGPGTFPLERLLAIFQCITSLAEDSLDEEESHELTVEGGSRGLMSDVLLQLSSLCNANFIIKGGSCPLEGSTRYRTAVSEDLALKVARSLKFPLSKYLYRR